MNLRQKVKWAKKELKRLDEHYPSGTMLDIYEKTIRKIELQKIIDYKRKPSRPYRWDEDYKIDWGKLTYIGFQVDFKELLRLSYPNGRVLLNKEIKAFLSECLPIFQKESERVSKIDIDSKDRHDYWRGKRKRVDYALSVSNDRTKSKRFHIEYRFFQYEGDDRIYQYENGKR